MRPRVIVTDFIFSVRAFLRSKGTLFWTLAFPVILILIFGAIFSGVGDVEYELYIQDLDKSEMSQGFIKILEDTGVLKIINVSSSKNVTSHIEKESIKRLIVIPDGFQEDIGKAFVDPSTTVNLTFYLV